ncbi:MAG: hypothetical protein ACK5TA_07465, partial [bacterium]
YSGHENAELLSGDITDYGTIDQLEYMIGERQLHGMVVNAGGPPAKMVLETSARPRVFDQLEFDAAAPPLTGKSDAATSFRRARASRMREDAEAMSGLLAKPSVMTRLRAGSSKRPHQRLTSRCADADGNAAAFFKAVGISGETFCESVMVQAASPNGTKQ